MTRTPLKYGFLAALIISLATLLPFLISLGGDFDAQAFVANMGRWEVVGYLTMVLAMGLVFFAVREHREKRVGHQYTFVDGLKVGLVTVLVASFLFGMATTAVYASLGDETVDQFMRVYIESTVPSGATEEDREKAIARYESERDLWLNPWFQGLVMAITVFAIGLIISLISAWVLRRSPAT